MDVKYPEKEKRRGIHYVVARDGVELPVIDVTHPAFALTVSDLEQRELIDKFLEEDLRQNRLPKPIRKSLWWFFLRKSVLGRGIRQAQGGFLTGMHTYLLKLGPEMLGSAYAKPIDRKIAASLPAMAVRLRLQDVAQLMVDLLKPALLADPVRPVRFVNIAGGPAADSMNALLLLNKQSPGILAGHEITIDVLDRDETGPEFGRASLAAVCSHGRTLSKVRAVFRHISYDWSEAQNLKQILTATEATNALIVCSSEGGLFEYGSDQEIEANLRVLRACPSVLAVVGSVTRADEPMQRLRKNSTLATRPRGLDVFRALIEPTGWSVSRVIERPFSDQVVLT